MPSGPDLTPEQQKELEKILEEVNAVKSVIGSLIVGHDGVLLASKLPSRYDAEFLGLTALGVFTSTIAGIKKMDHQQLHQIVAKTNRGHMTIADFGEGLLVTLTDDTAVESSTKVMQRILRQRAEHN
ncbi:MAG TPA: roadblock/LC7 domain-containing protein [Drouetiella sp.]